MSKLSQAFDFLAQRGKPGMTVVNEQKKQISEEDVLARNMFHMASSETCKAYFLPWLEEEINRSEQQADVAVGSIQGAVMTGEKQALKRVLQNFKNWADKG